MKWIEMATKKQSILKIVNIAALFLFLVQAISGIAHEAIPFAIFEKLHGTTGYLLVAVVMTHILLNWSWFKSNFIKQ